ncbi:MAG TPA: nucleotide exchange factor GrpE [Atopostipes sp.]|nr:nucleotide exchange factor GrpE [Atopostipes sp.]
MTDKEKEFEKDETLEEEIQSETTEDTAVDEVSELNKKIDELEDQNLRLQAELQNIIRRNKKDRELSTRYRAQDLAKDILPVKDNLERALENADEANEGLTQGVQMVLDGFNRAFEANDIEEIEAEGQPFDPNFHEAYAQVPAEDGQESGVVAQVYEKGYKLHDRVLRAAKVTVTQ